MQTSSVRHGHSNSLLSRSTAAQPACRLHLQYGCTLAWPPHHHHGMHPCHARSLNGLATHVVPAANNAHAATPQTSGGPADRHGSPQGSFERRTQSEFGSSRSSHHNTRSSSHGTGSPNTRFNGRSHPQRSQYKQHNSSNLLELSDALHTLSTTLEATSTSIPTNKAVAELYNLTKLVKQPGSSKHRPAISQLSSQLQALMQQAPDGHTTSRLHDMDSRRLSNTLYSLSQLHRRGFDVDQELVVQLVVQAAEGQSMKQGNAQDWSNLLLACGYLGLGAAAVQPLVPGLVKAVVEQRCLEGARPQCWSNILWSAATVGIDPSSVQPLVHEVVRACQQGCLKGASSQEWCNLLWALATMKLEGAAAQPLLVQMLLAVDREQCMQGATPQCWTNLLWSLASLGYDHRSVQPLVDELMHVARQERPMWQAKAQDWSNLFWALATMDYKATAVQPLVAQLVNAVAHGGCMAEASPQAWSNIWWALAAMRVTTSYVGPMLPVFGHASTMRKYVAEANCQNWANMLWGLAKLSVYNQKLFHLGCAAVAAAAAASQCKSQELSNLLYACGQVGHLPQGPAGLVDAMHATVDKWLAQANNQDLANMVHALVTLDLYDHPLVGLVLEQVSGRGAAGFKELELCQLFQAHLELSDQGQAMRGLQGPLLAAAGQAWQAQLQDGVVVSESQQEMAAAVQALGYEGVELEGYSQDGLFRVDVAVEVSPGCRVAVEFDGPTHFLFAPKNLYNGPSLLRQRQLRRQEQRGFSGLVLVPYFLWDGGNRQKQLQFLKREIECAAAGGEGLLGRF